MIGNQAHEDVTVVRLTEIAAQARTETPRERLDIGSAAGLVE